MNQNLNKKDIIIFIDDEKICHSLVELIIPNFTNYKLVSAFNGIEAINLAKRYNNNIALVLCDIMLPDLNGYEIYQYFNEDEKLKNIPFIFQSGLPNQEVEIKNMLGNNVKIIYKPYRQEDLLRNIHTALGNN